MRVFLSVKKVTKTNAFLKSFFLKKRTEEILWKILLLSLTGTKQYIHEKRTKLLQFDEKNILMEGRIFDLHAKGNWRIFDCYTSE